MNLQLSEDQVLLKDSLSKALAKQCSPAHIRTTEANGHDPQTWSLFHELGMTLLRVPEADGGVGAGLLDAVVVAETLGEYVPVIPGIEVIVVARLLAKLGATEQLARIFDGDIAVFALHDASAQPEQLIAHATAAALILFRTGDQVRALTGWSRHSQIDIGSLGARNVNFATEQSVLLSNGPEAIDAYLAAVEEWRLLNAARVAAAARKALTNAAEYAKERHAFGRPIGSFQGLAHPLADRSVDVDGAGLLVWRAVEAIAQGDKKAAATISLAAWWAGQAARPASVLAMRVFGGYGVAMEYDAQIYFRRITAWSLLVGDPEAELQRAADRLWNNVTVPLPDAGHLPISFDLPEHAQAAAAEVRQIFAAHVNDQRREWSFNSDDGFDPELFKKLGAAKLLFPDWPAEYGGRGVDSYTASAIRGVYIEYGWSDTIVAVTELLGRTLIDFGSERAKAELVPKLAKGELYASLGYSEPSCGSDLFAARTRAVRDGDGDGDDWVIDGQKMFTSQGHMAHYALMVTRTGEDKHRGITLFAVPLDQRGYRCDPIETLGGERTNTTFYEGMRVSDELRIGEVNGGAKVLALALAKEQGSMELFIGALKEMLASGVEWARSHSRGGAPLIADRHVRAVLAGVAARLEVIGVLHRRALWAYGTGNAQKHHGPSGKLFGSESMISCSAELMALTAPDSLLQGFTTLGRIEREYRRSIAATIYMGTSEVQRSIIAEAGLGLPRTRN